MLDTNNNSLHVQIAQITQQNQLLNRQVELLQGRLTETVERLRETETTKSALQQQLTTLQDATTRGGGAILTANNSGLQKLESVQIEGVETKQEGDVLRILVPSDQVFVNGTAQLTSAAVPMAGKIAQAIRNHYPKQIVVIEGHADGASGFVPLQGSKHALTAAQATALFEQFTRSGHLPEKQLRIMAHGATHPRYSNGSVEGQQKNRRMEVVIYPEQF